MKIVKKILWQMKNRVNIATITVFIDFFFTSTQIHIILCRSNLIRLCKINSSSDWLKIWRNLQIQSKSLAPFLRHSYFYMEADADNVISATHHVSILFLLMICNISFVYSFSLFSSLIRLQNYYLKLVDWIDDKRCVIRFSSKEVLQNVLKEYFQPI